MFSRQTLVREPQDRPDHALSIRHPWAWAILYAGKRVENRTWYTAFRGPIYIHAGLVAHREAIEDLREEILAVPAPRPPAVCGALIGTARIVDCVRRIDVAPPQAGWALGPWCFVLDEVRALETPIAHRGSLGIFVVPDLQSSKTPP